MGYHDLQYVKVVTVVMELRVKKDKRVQMVAMVVMVVLGLRDKKELLGLFQQIQMLK